jgi:radical SAM superfamily enzyme YgiQ (UPF0313 family)
MGWGNQATRSGTFTISRVKIVELRSTVPHLLRFTLAPWHGIILLASLARSHGFDAEALVEGISEFTIDDFADADVVAFTIAAGNIEASRRLVERIRARNPRAIIIGGGPLSKTVPTVFSDFCDFVIRGEGEDAFIELLEALRQGSDVRQVGGLTFVHEGQVHNTPQRPFTKRLDVVADLDSVRGYHPRSALRNAIDRRIYMMTVEASRGCPYACKFCIAPDFYGSYRPKTVDNVLRELRQRRRFSNNVWFIDNLFSVRRQFTVELLNRIIAEGLNDGSYKCFLRVENARDRELLALLPRAGFDGIFVGFESIREGNQRQWRKNLRVTQMIDAIRAYRAHGLAVHGSFVLGGDGDRAEDVTATCDFAIENELALMNIFALTPVQVAGDACLPRHRNLASSWDYMTGDFVTYFPTHMRPSVLQATLAREYLRFYSLSRLPGIVRRFGLHGGFAFGTIGYALRKMFADPVFRDYQRRLEAIEAPYYSADDLLLEDRLPPEGVGSAPWIDTIDTPARLARIGGGRFIAQSCNEGARDEEVGESLAGG